MSIPDTIERVVFGASAVEAVELRIKLATQRASGETPPQEG